MLSTEEKERYQVHFKLENFDESTQLKLKKTKVFVVGAGGLGCNVLLHLACIGIGTITIIDDDTVSMSNLQRQHFFTHKDIGKFKSEIAKEQILKLNPFGNYKAIIERFTSQVSLGDFDIIVDCSDNIATRYIIDKACRTYNIPFVYGGVEKYEGQVGVFGNKGIDFSRAFPDKQTNFINENCNSSGVISPLVGIIGSMQAMEVFKLITSFGQPLISKILYFNALTYNTKEIIFK